MADEANEKARPGKKLWTPEGEVAPGAPEETEPAEDAEELSEEELRKRLEEVMEKITVAEIVIDMMISLSSLAFQRMGLPHEVNAKYKDMEQARMAVDCIDAMAGALEGRVPAEVLDPLKSTLSSLKMNFAKEA